MKFNLIIYLMGCIVFVFMLFFAYKRLRGKDIRNNIYRLLFLIRDTRYYPEKFLSLSNIHFNTKKRLLFILTEDNELTGNSIKKFNTEMLFDNNLYYHEFIEKFSKADKLLNKENIYWSHFIDLGSSLLFPNWAYKESKNDIWQQIFHKRIEVIHNSITRGNDIQLHIHGELMPDSNFFSFKYIGNNKFQYIDNRGINKTRGFWYQAYPKDILHSKFHEHILLFKSYLPADYDLFAFRAGGFDLGETKDTVLKSFDLLTDENFFFDSSLVIGNHNEKADIGKSIFEGIIKIKSKNNKSIFEVFPTKFHLFTGMSFGVIDPLYNSPEQFIKIYNKALLQSQNGLFIFTGLTHLKDYFWNYNEDFLNNAYFKKLIRFFDKIKESCPELEFINLTKLRSILKDR